MGYENLGIGKFPAPDREPELPVARPKIRAAPAKKNVRPRAYLRGSNENICLDIILLRCYYKVYPVICIIVNNENNALFNYYL